MTQTVYRSVLVLCLTIFTTACLGPVTALYPADISDRPITVYVSSHRWHVGIVAQASYMEAHLPRIEGLPASRYLEFGWGDAAYYPHPDPGPGILLRAALLPTSSVLHISGFDYSVEHMFPNSTLVRLQLSEAGMAELAAFLADSIATQEDTAVVVAAGLYGDSLFVEAHGTYMLPNTSNLWAARALRAAGLPITPIYALTQNNVIRQASRSGELIQEN